MTLATQPIALEDFLKLPDIEESPARELFNGVVIQKPMPTLHHSILQKRLVAVIDNAGSQYEAFPEFRCILRQGSMVPDVTIVRRDCIPSTNTPLQGAPDWMIEMLSPDQNTTNLIEKIQACLQEGSRLGWLIDPSEQVVMIFWPDRPLAFLRGASQLPVLEDIALTLTVENLFSWL